MHLKSVTINGFKSFANKTKLDFLPPEDGKKSITTIVGPNGSGKSNVSDAIRWVMGEQSLSNIRAKTNKDIIFSGSEKKSKLSRASVSIVLDNSGDELDMDYDEITITRRYYRSGESQYLINGEDVRLLDIKLLLAKANFARSSYSVISQGMVDKMILQSPSERKDFFDEAFGIKEQQIKRHQAWLKLNRTKENIDEVSSVLREIKPRLDTLSEKAEKLKKRKELKLKLTELQESYYSTVWQKNKEKISDIKDKLSEINEAKENTEEKLENIQSKLAKLAQGGSRQNNFDKLQEKLEKKVDEKNSLEQKKAVLEGKLQNEYSKAGKENINWLRNKKEELDKKHKQHKNDIENLRGQQEEIEQELEEKQEKYEKLKDKKDRLTSRKNDLQSKLDKAKREESIQQYTGISAVQAVLKNKNKFGQVYGTIAQLGEVEEKFMMALDIAAGGRLSSVVVEDDSVAESCIEYLRSNKLGYATFLPLNKINARYTPNDLDQFLNHPMVYDLAVNLVDFDDKFYDVFSYSLGGTLVVENVQAAREVGIGRIRMVTLDGDVLNKSGSMKGGYRNKKRKVSFSQSLPSSEIDVEQTKEKIKSVEEALEKINSRIEKLGKNINDLNNQKQKISNQVQLNIDSKEEVKQELEEVKENLKLADLDPDQYSEEMQGVQNKKEKVDKQIGSLSEEIDKIKSKIKKFNEKEENKKKEIFSLQERMQERQDKLNKITEKKNKKEIKVAKLETKQEDLIQEVKEEMNDKIQHIVARNDETIEWSNRKEVYKEIKDTKYKLNLIGEIDEEVIEEYKETKQRYEELEGQLNDLQEAMKNTKNLVKELDEVMKTKRKEVFSEIKDEFSRYFKKLFGGGKAELTKQFGQPEEENVFDEELNEEKLVGIEIEASPPGKKIDNLEVLSGGEKTMTSIALICAIISVNPSPCVVLDEVEAALDESNSSKFVDILHELSEDSQFILITHNRITMHAADALYGVTMGNDGVSDVLSVKLEKAEQMVEEEV